MELPADGPVAGPSPAISVSLGEGCTAAVPMRDAWARTTLSSVAPVKLQGYPRNVAAKVLLYVRTGRTSLVGMTVQELGQFIYLADSLGVYGIIDAVQKKYDEFKPEKTNEGYKVAAELINISTLATSVNPEQLARSLSFEYLVANPLCMENLWSPSMALLINLLPSPQEDATESEELRSQLDLFNAILHWINHIQPSESILLQILISLPELDKICQALPHPQNEDYVPNEEVEEIYFEKILGNRYEMVWNQWLETKFRKGGKSRVAVMEEGNIRARFLPDHLFENARSNVPPSRASPPAQDSFDWNMANEEMGVSAVEERAPLPLNVVHSPAAMAPWQVARPRKITLLKDALKAPFIKIKNRLTNRNNR